MKLLKVLIILSTVLLSACETDPKLAENVFSCRDNFGSNEDHPLHFRLQALLEEITASGVAGIMMSVYDETQGRWSGTAGKADLANNIDLEPCQITRVGSTVKTFTAATLLLLQEEGKLNLDDPVSSYLNPDYLQGLANAERVTIRQLLQHATGIPNYIVNTQFQLASLNNLTKVWTKEELLAYARNLPPDFEPGTDLRYSNTNYILLGGIIEAVEEKPFFQVFKEKLFLPLQLMHTQFAAEDPVPRNIIRGYTDLYSNLQLINSTEYSGWDYFTADGGLISNAHDLNIFMTQLFEGQILSEHSMREMMTWLAPKTQDREGFETDFGLGVFRIQTDFGPAYMHSGDAIGYFASMVYFPDQKVCITWAVNSNYGEVDEFTQSKAAMNHIFASVLE